MKFSELPMGALFVHKDIDRLLHKIDDFRAEVLIIEHHTITGAEIDYWHAHNNPEVQRIYKQQPVKKDLTRK